jgi:hypothetical protein
MLIIDIMGEIYNTNEFDACSIDLKHTLSVEDVNLLQKHVFNWNVNHDALIGLGPLVLALTWRDSDL